MTNFRKDKKEKDKKTKRQKTKGKKGWVRQLAERN